MRSNEMLEGIELFNSDEQMVGKSPLAGKYAVAMGAVSRTVVAGLSLTVPPLLMAPLERTSLFKRSPVLSICAQLSLIFATLVTAVPMSIAMFPQRFEISTGRLEPRFHAMRSPDGAPIKHLYYNRGL